ncbi:MAG: hypothetical protein DLM65_12340 [Candidatus Aeolococcus gillhamiae]|uniref:Glycosyltransferase family 1 protein n=1 Tax=Candidatus Aeolococcus gillhamiae TaxID=3127015 RepID=A0A2W5Z3H5_9BACT|nr:MAG: hypothetical protein DLM65_12340 [Candidatus Dormibacter sp. RRmetagenome_bin12]
MRSRRPRKALHVSWACLGRPRIDRVLGHPDLIHVLSPAVRVPCRTRVVYTVHDLMPITSPTWYTPKQRWLFGRAITEAASRAALLIADSQRTADQVTARLGVHPSRIRVVHLAVDQGFFSASDAGEIQRVCASNGVEPGRYLVAVGAVSSRKNLRVVIEALAQLGHGSSPIKLLAVGPEGLGYQETHALVRERHLEDVVRFTGWLPIEDVRLLLSGAAALVHPSVDEGFGMPPLEAMASGVPAIVSDAGSLPEVTGSAAILVDPHDAEGWAAAIRQVADDNALRTDLVARGRAHVADFSWDRVAAETIAVHRAALSL